MAQSQSSVRHGSAQRRRTARSESLFCALRDRSTRGPPAQRFKRHVWRDPALLSRWTLVGTLEEHRGCVNTLHWSKEGDVLLSGSDDCRVCLWSCAGADQTTLASAVITGHRRNIFSACFVPETSNRQVSVRGQRAVARGRWAAWWLPRIRATFSHTLLARDRRCGFFRLRRW